MQLGGECEHRRPALLGLLDAPGYRSRPVQQLVDVDAEHGSVVGIGMLGGAVERRSRVGGGRRGRFEVGERELGAVDDRHPLGAEVRGVVTLGAAGLVPRSTRTPRRAPQHLVRAGKRAQRSGHDEQLDHREVAVGHTRLFRLDGGERLVDTPKRCRGVDDSLLRHELGDVVVVHTAWIEPATRVTRMVRARASQHTRRYAYPDVTETAAIEFDNAAADGVRARLDKQEVTRTYVGERDRPLVHLPNPLAAARRGARHYVRGQVDEQGFPDTTIGLLGPVVLVRGDDVVATRSALLRTLVALLALHAGSPVDTAVIIEELWGDALPQDPRAALHVLVARLRKWLAAAGCAASVDHEHGGYTLRVAEDGVDLHRFDADARAAVEATEPAARLAACDRTLAAWRGDPFLGCVPGVSLESEAARLRELRVQLVEARAEALLETGRHAAAIPELRGMLAEHPLRERLAALAMLALYRDGRQREALSVFRELREALLDCGLEPGRALVELERRILQQDDDLAAPDRAALPDPPSAAPSRPSLVGRTRELGLVVDAVAASSGSLLLVTGDAGSGKSTFLRAAAHDAAAAGARVAVAGWEGDLAPFAAWLNVLVQLAVDAAEVRGRSEPLTEVVRSRLRDLARSGPVLVALDDVHLADSASLALLTAMASSAIPEGAVVVVAARDHDASPRPEWLEVRAALARLDGVAEVPLGPLAADDVRDLVALELDAGDDDAASLVPVILDRTGGNPLHVVALLDVLAPHAGTDARIAAAAEVPPSMRHLVRAQLGALPEGCRDLVEVLALLAPTSLDLLARVSGHRAIDAARLLRPAIDIGLVVDTDGVVEMRHAITADSVVDTIPPSTRAVIHRACLDELDAAGADPFRRLRHARAAGAIVPPARVAAVELDAGLLAYERGAHEDAAALLASALTDLDGTGRLLALLHLGLARAALGDGAAADVLDAVLDDASDDTDADVLVTAAVGDELFGLRVGGDERRLARLRRVEARTRGSSTPTRARLLRNLVAEERLAVQPDRAAVALDELEAIADSLDSEVERTHVALLRTREWLNDSAVAVHVQKDLAEQLYRSAEKIGDRALRLEALESCVSTSVMVGELEHAQDYLWELSREAARTRRPRSMWAAAVVDAALLHAAGEERAASRAEEASALGTTLAIDDALGALGAFVAVDRWRRGELQEVRAIADMAMDTYPGVAAWKAVAASACAQAGERDDASRLLDEYLASRSSARFRLFDKAGLAIAATTAATVGRVDVAGSLRAALGSDEREIVIVGVGAAVLGPLSLYAGIASGVAGDPDAATGHLAAAEALATEVGWSPWAEAAAHARAVLLSGDAPATPYTLGLVRTG